MLSIRCVAVNTYSILLPTHRHTHTHTRISRYVLDINTYLPACQLRKIAVQIRTTTTTINQQLHDMAQNCICCNVLFIFTYLFLYVQGRHETKLRVAAANIEKHVRLFVE